MGTNYYYHEKKPCECCGRAYDLLHIGKSSGGWHFSLHVIPEKGINDLDDWKKLFEKGGIITDEYEGEIKPEIMLEIITQRMRENPVDWTKSELDRNHAENGLNNLVRAKVGEYCVKNGAGTWDCITGDFS